MRTRLVDRTHDRRAARRAARAPHAHRDGAVGNARERGGPPSAATDSAATARITAPRRLTTREDTASTARRHPALAGMLDGELQRRAWAGLSTVALLGCGAPAIVPVLAPREASPAPSEQVAAAPARVDLRSYDLAVEDCSDLRSPLARALWVELPWFVAADWIEWGGPARCAIFVRGEDGRSDVPGASFADVDGDGIEEAIALVEIRRARIDGFVDRALGVRILGAGAHEPVVLITVPENDVIAGASSSFDVARGRRSSGRGRSGGPRPATHQRSGSRATRSVLAALVLRASA